MSNALGYFALLCFATAIGTLPLVMYHYFWLIWYAQTATGETVMKSIFVRDGFRSAVEMRHARRVRFLLPLFCISISAFVLLGRVFRA